MLDILVIMWDKALGYLSALGLGAFLLEIYKRQKGKKRESLEISKLTTEGENSLTVLKTNIKKEVEEKTTALTAQILELNETIVSISVKNEKELKLYLKRMGELEQKVDDQRARADKIEDRSQVIETQKEVIEKNLEEEITIRKACLKQLEELHKQSENLKTRVAELEKNTLQTNTLVTITNNPPPEK